MDVNLLSGDQRRWIGTDTEDLRLLLDSRDKTDKFTIIEVKIHQSLDSARCSNMDGARSAEAIGWR